MSVIGVFSYLNFNPVQYGIFPDLSLLLPTTLSRGGGGQ